MKDKQLYLMMLLGAFAFVVGVFLYTVVRN
jgi:hypothetical protein